MPTYQYACTACQHELEAVQSFSDAALTECPECGGRLRKVYGAVGVVFKGSGFYRTDSRSGSSASVPSGGATSDSSSSSSDSTSSSGAKSSDGASSSATSSGAASSGSGSGQKSSTGGSSS